MAAFPILKTGAVAQYPAVRGNVYSTSVLRFVDGNEQRFRNAGSALRRWQIRLDLLDDGELAEVELFFTTAGGQIGTFSFTDPWDNTEYPSCSLEQDEFRADFAEEARAGGQLIIRENRS